MIRSFLFVPASVARFVAKAHEYGADAIILDLEDGVAPAEKDRAREALMDAVPAVTRRGAKAFVRINSVEETGFEDAEAACRAGAFGIFVPKTQTAGSLVALDQALAGVERRMDGRPPVRLVPMIEDPGAVFDARAIAAATPRNFGIVAGAEDLSAEYNADPTPELLRLPKLMVHMAAKAARIYSFGLMRTIADFNNKDAVRTAARESRSLGFDGASCIHPTIVPILNEEFSATAAELDRAQRMISAFEDAIAKGLGAFVFEGKMVDKPIVDRARGLIEAHSVRVSAAEA